MRVLGLMSGTSLDGLDMALVDLPNGKPSAFRILHAQTIEYSEDWRSKLEKAFSLPDDQIRELSKDYGVFLGEQVRKILRDWGPIDLIASHGHTIFHQPAKGITLQIGNGPEIHQITEIPVVCDFRKQDVELGGQGAPLVPIGDQILFGQFDGCLNLGGFSNISFCDETGQRLAFDITAVNIVLNELAGRLGQPYDKDGQIAGSHPIDPDLLNELDSLAFYHLPPPRSLGKEWVEEVVMPILQATALPPETLLATFTEHAAGQIGGEIRMAGLKKVLVTGGGAYNQTLMKGIEDHSHAEIIRPDDTLIQFKEALIFALLGWLRWHDRTNVLSSVTGARKDHSSGIIWK